MDNFTWGVGLIGGSLILQKVKTGKKKLTWIMAGGFLFVLLFSVLYHVGTIPAWFDRFYDDGSNSYVIRHYLYAFCTMPTTYLQAADTFGISFMDQILIMFCCTFLFAFILDRKQYLNIFLPMTLVLGIGGIIYIIGHASMYTAMFSGSEREILSAFSRYLRIYLSGVFGFVLYILYGYCSEKGRRAGAVKGLGFLIVCTCLSCNICSMVGTLQYSDWQYSSKLLERREKAKKVEEIVKANTDGSYQYIWCGRSEDNWAQLELRYLLAPLRRSAMIFVDTCTIEELRSVLSGSVAQYCFIQQAFMTETEWEQLERLLNELNYDYVETKSQNLVKIYKTPVN